MPVLQTDRRNQLPGLTQLAIDRPLTVFFTLAYACAWIVLGPMVFFRGPMELIALASFGPTAAAIITHRLATGTYQAFRIYSTWPRTVAATGVGIAVIIVAYVVVPAVVSSDPHKLNWSILISVAVYNYSTLLGGPLGEEPGWRGYALPRLEARVGPIRASLLVGLLWAGWHAPLFLIPGWTSSPPWVYVLFLTGLSLILTWGANVARFGVVTPIAMHAAFNTVSRFLSGLFTETQPRAPIPFELLLAPSGIAAALVLVVITRGRLGYHAIPDLTHARRPNSALEPTARN
jgi:membrane protease YdiL (CAAX protease family)